MRTGLRFVRYAGTWFPLVLLFFVAIVVTEALTGASPQRVELEQRSAILIGGLAMLLGIHALIQMMRYSFGGYPSLFILTFFYQKVTYALVLIAVVFPGVPEAVEVAVLVAAMCSTVILNLILYFGRKRGWLPVAVDPIPFRFLWHLNEDMPVHVTGYGEDIGGERDYERTRFQNERSGWQDRREASQDRVQNAQDARTVRQSKRGMEQDERGKEQDRRFENGEHEHPRHEHPEGPKEE